MPSVSSCFLHVFCIAVYPYQTKSKCNKISRRIILEYMWFWGVEITTNRGPHSPQDIRAPPRPLARGGGLCSPRTSVGAILWAQGSLYPEKNRVKISAQPELRISGNIRNGFWPDPGNAKQKRTEREIQSRRGSRPSAAMEAMDHRGTLLPSWGGGRPRKKKEEGALSPSLPVAPECRRGNDRDGDLHQQSCYRQHQLSLPPWCSGVTPLIPAVIST